MTKQLFIVWILPASVSSTHLMSVLFEPICPVPILGPMYSYGKVRTNEDPYNSSPFWAIILPSTTVICLINTHITHVISKENVLTSQIIDLHWSPSYLQSWIWYVCSCLNPSHALFTPVCSSTHNNWTIARLIIMFEQ